MPRGARVRRREREHQLELHHTLRKHFFHPIISDMAPQLARQLWGQPPSTPPPPPPVPPPRDDKAAVAALRLPSLAASKELSFPASAERFWSDSTSTANVADAAVRAVELAEEQLDKASKWITAPGRGELIRRHLATAQRHMGQALRHPALSWDIAAGELRGQARQSYAHFVHFVCK